VRSLHQCRGPQPYDSAIANPTLRAALPSRIFLATYWSKRPGLSGLSDLWCGLRIRLHHHAPNRPPCNPPRDAEGTVESFKSNLNQSLVRRAQPLTHFLATSSSSISKLPNISPASRSSDSPSNPRTNRATHDPPLGPLTLTVEFCYESRTRGRVRPSRPQRFPRAPFEREI
jgi:hypothetical protein